MAKPGLLLLGAIGEIQRNSTDCYETSPNKQ